MYCCALGSCPTSVLSTRISASFSTSDGIKSYGIAGSLSQDLWTSWTCWWLQQQWVSLWAKLVTCFLCVYVFLTGMKLCKSGAVYTRVGVGWLQEIVPLWMTLWRSQCKIKNYTFCMIVCVCVCVWNIPLYVFVFAIYLLVSYMCSNQRLVMLGYWQLWFIYCLSAVCEFLRGWRSYGLKPFLNFCPLSVFIQFSEAFCTAHCSLDLARDHAP